MNIIHIVSIVCFSLCLVMFFYLKWYIKKRTSASGLEERQIEVARLIAEIDRITDRDSQLVEDRINQLKAILEDTDKRIAVYIKELEKSRTGEALYTSLGRGIRAALTTPAQPPPASTVHPHNLPGIAAQTETPPLVPPVVQPPQMPALPKGKPSSKKQIRANIDNLLNEGLSPQEIASRLDISVAEVNLAMNLRRNK